MGFLRPACTCEETCESVWPPNATLYASSTCGYLRLLASPFNQGLKLKLIFNFVVVSSSHSFDFIIAYLILFYLSSKLLFYSFKQTRIKCTTQGNLSFLHFKTDYRERNSPLLTDRNAWLGMSLSHPQELAASPADPYFQSILVIVLLNCAISSTDHKVGFPNPPYLERM